MRRKANQSIHRHQMSLHYAQRPPSFLIHARGAQDSKPFFTRLLSSSAMTWKQAVELLYPYQETKLETYMRIIEELFQAAPHSPSVTILVDVKAQDQYV